MRAEMKALEVSGGSSVVMWKSKAQEMVEVCLNL
jgi:hypothetical protein